MPGMLMSRSMMSGWGALVTSCRALSPFVATTIAYSSRRISISTWIFSGVSSTINTFCTPEPLPIIFLPGCFQCRCEQFQTLFGAVNIKYFQLPLQLPVFTSKGAACQVPAQFIPQMHCPAKIAVQQPSHFFNYILRHCQVDGKSAGGCFQLFSPPKPGLKSGN